MRGIIVFAHGSRVESANQAVRNVAADLARVSGDRVEAAFLELGQPDLPGAAARLVDAGADSITVVPYFLTLGMHMERDLPRAPLRRVEDRAAGGRNPRVGARRQVRPRRPRLSDRNGIQGAPPVHFRPANSIWSVI